MKLFSILPMLFAVAMALPEGDLEERHHRHRHRHHRAVCRSGTQGACCQVDLGSVGGLACTAPRRVFHSKKKFRASCQSTGAGTANCCEGDLLGVGLLCDEV